jgi:NADH dehydrogenase
VISRVLVAGGTGRLGTLVVDGMAVRGVDVRVMTRDPQRAAHLTREHVEVVTGDVRDLASTTAAAAGVDVVVSAVHGFAGPGGGSPATVDRDGNIHLIQAAHLAGAEVVLMSVVGAAPDSPFELFRMKHAAETALATSGMPATIVRATAFIELWIDLLSSTAGRSNRPLVFGRGENPINFVSVGDVAALVERVVTDPTTRGQKLEIGGPDNLTMTDLARMVGADRGSSKNPRHLPRPALHIMAATVGRIRPELGRQARAALAMDRYDLTFDVDVDAVRARFPDLPSSSAAQVLQALHATDRSANHPATETPS